MEQHKNIGSLVRAVPHFAGFTLEFALQLRKKHGKNLSQGSRRVPAGTMKIHKRTIKIHRHNNKNT
jgi:hypothetical protein